MEATAAAGVSHGFEFHEATVEAIHLGFTNGSLTSEALVQFYLDQISRHNKLLHAVIEVNPDALMLARAADRRRKVAGGRLISLLDGIPVLLKDNIASFGPLNTTVGSFALLGSVVRRDAGVVTKLRRNGAFLLGKANPTEWCNIRTVDDGWSARGGLTLVITNQTATQARAADARRKTAGGRLIGALDGIPVLLKDNIATRDALNTTAGSFALRGSVVKRDAGVVTRLRRAGAVVLGKANPSEWSNFRVVQDGWSARGGQTLNPYVLSSTPCGSSAGPGVAAAANMAAVTLGTETDGSILCPASLNSVVGIKPTVGLTSRSGVIPITPRQDTVGPMCRTVSDAVQVLDAIVGYDAFDAAATRAASKFIPHGGYMQFLKKDGLRGKRIGVPNGFFQGYGEARLRVYKQHLATMREHGAMVIENLVVAANLTALLADIASNEGIAMQAEFKLSINAYLADLLSSPVHSLADIIVFNNANPIQERLKDFGQDDLIAAENTHGIGPMERAAIRQLNKLSADGFEKLMKEHQLDAIVTPNSNASSLLAIGGHPGIVVPAGYSEEGVPFAICFGGLQGYEPRLIEMAYAFEQVTRVRRSPMFKP